MTHRERFRAILRGEASDRPAAVCRLDIWHRARRHAADLPPEVARLSLEELQLRLGFGVSARAARVFRQEYRAPVRHVSSREGPRVIDEWVTGKGTLRMVRQYEGDQEVFGIRPAIVEHPVRCLDDYAIYEEIVRHQVWTPDFEGYRQYDRQVGENGLPMVLLGTIPIHDLMITWVGYENACDHLYNSPEIFLRAVDVANEKAREMWEIVAGSPCELILYGAHYDSAMTPPPLFKKHFLPYVQAFNCRMHQAGKRVAFHADADLTLLLDLILEADFDVMDCLAVSPLVRCTFREIHRRCGHRIVSWGGIPSTLLEPPFTLPQLHEHLRMLRSEADGGRNFIFGLSDQAMPGSFYESLRAIADFIQNL
jgi:hypothetical protein